MDEGFRTVKRNGSVRWTGRDYTSKLFKQRTKPGEIVFVHEGPKDRLFAETAYKDHRGRKRRGFQSITTLQTDEEFSPNVSSNTIPEVNKLDGQKPE